MIAYDEGAQGTTVMTADSQSTALGSLLLVLVASWSPAYFVRGVVAGAVAGSGAKLNGVITVMLDVVVGTA